LVEEDGDRLVDRHYLLESTRQHQVAPRHVQEVVPRRGVPRTRAAVRTDGPPSFPRTLRVPR